MWELDIQSIISLFLATVTMISETMIWLIIIFTPSEIYFVDNIVSKDINFYTIWSMIEMTLGLNTSPEWIRPTM